MKTPMDPLKFWTIFVALITIALVIACFILPADAQPLRNEKPKVPGRSPIPVVRIGKPYIAELRLPGFPPPKIKKAQIKH